MKLSLTSWSLPACSLVETAGIARTLGFEGLDIGYFYRSALPRARVLDDPDGLAHEVAALGITVPNFYHLFGESLADRNLADPASLDRNTADFARVARFCRAAGVPTILVLPGICNAGQGRREALAQSAKALAALLPLAQDAGVVLTIEPHVHSYLESPPLVLELLQAVPGLKLTLDYAHFACLGYRQEEIDPLACHAAHVHLRQARPGALQTPLHQGTLNVPAMLAALRDAGYTGAVSVEWVHQDYMNTRYEDVLTETIAARDAVRAWLGQS